MTQGNLTNAKSLIHEALTLADIIDALPILLETLVGLASLSLRTKAEVFAAELAGLIEHHPSLRNDVRVGEFANLKRELDAAISTEEMAAALERGKALDVRAVVQKILTENAS